MLVISDINVLQEVLEAVTDAVAVYGNDLRLLAINAAYRKELRGFFCCELTGGTKMSDALSHHPEELERVERLFRKALEGEEFESRVELLNEAGERHMFVMRFRPIRLAEAAVDGVVQTVRDVTRQLEAEGRVRTFAELQRLALGVAKIGTWEYNIETGLAYGDLRARELLEFDKTYVSWDEFMEHVLEEDRTPMTLALQNALAKGLSGEFDVEYRIRRRDGTVRWMRSLGAMVPGAFRSSLTGVTMDITEAKELEEIRKKSQDKFKLIFNNTYDMILLHDEHGQIIDANETFLKTYSATLDEIVGRSVVDISSSSAPLETLDDIWRAVMNGAPQLFEWKARTLDRRREFDVEVFLRGVEIEGRRLIMANLHDVTFRKQSEARLRESEDRFRTLANNISQGVWMADEHGQNVWYNERWLDFTGLSLEQLVGEGWKNAVHPDHRDRVVASAANSIEKGEEWENIFPVRGRNGEYRWFLARAVPLRDKDGRIVRWFGTSTDVTRQRENAQALRLANEQLRQLAESLSHSNRDLEQFSYVASHDLQEPLRQIVSFVELLQKRYGQMFDPEAREYFGYITEGASRAQLLINDLLAFSRLGRSEQTFADVDLSRLVHIALRNLQLSISESEAEIEVGELPKVKGNATALVQVFQNLISNAVKFRRKERPRIRLDARRGEGEWIISVQDNGIGFSDNEKERIFQLFQRLHPRGRYPGTGIGLAICRRAVELHGGRIWVESTPGKGSTFYFTIPERPLAPPQTLGGPGVNP